MKSERKINGEVVLQALAIGFTLISATLYVLGRGYLIGWYESAGVPLLTFSWSAQDVLLMGFLRTTIWIVVIYFVAASGVLVGLQRILFNAYKKWREENRPPTRPLPSEDAAILRWLWWIVCLLVIYGAALALFSFAASEGRSQFVNEYCAATGHEPPHILRKSTSKQSSCSAANSVDTLPYPYIKVTNLDILTVTKKSADISPSSVCGWLVQGSDKQLLLLHEEGLSLLGFGDQTFAWEYSDPGKCSDPK